MSDLAWFLLALVCSAAAGVLMAALSWWLLTRNLRAREQAVIDAELTLRADIVEAHQFLDERRAALVGAARTATAATNATIDEIRIDDRRAVENDDTIYMPKVDHA